jgi:DNA repair photolyase
VNVYTGCSHGCIYCYAPKVLRKTREEFAKVEPRKDIVESVRRQIAREGIVGKMIMLCFTCDPYPIGHDTSAMREVIRAIKESGNFVQILTKGDDTAQRDFDLLGEGDSFGVTWSGAHKGIEPHAASFRVRHRNIVVAKEEYGLNTWMSCEPVFDAQAIHAAIETLGSVDLWRIGKLNYMQSDIDWGAFGLECERLCKEYGRNYYIKEDLRRCMEADPNA